MAQLRKRTSENKATGTMGTTRRTYQRARFGNLPEQLGDARRAQVYLNPNATYVESETTTTAIPPVGTKARVEFDQKIGQLYAQGMSHLDISIEMNTSLATVRDIILRHGFTKGSKTRKDRRGS